MKKEAGPTAIHVNHIEPQQRSTGYPEPFAGRVFGRKKKKLGDYFGLKNFGVNLTTLPPGTESALMHRHSVQDEFVYILEGTPTLVTESGDTLLEPGMCAGFPAAGHAHHLVNKSNEDVTYIEVGDRLPGDEGSYPNDDLKAELSRTGQWVFSRKNGVVYNT